MNPLPYHVYIVSCEDGSLYTGIARDVKKRMKEHLSKGRIGAKYTRSRHVTQVLLLFFAQDRSSAQKLEYRIKTLSHKEKLSLCASPERFSDFFPDMDASQYRIDNETELSSLISSLSFD